MFRTYIKKNFPQTKILIKSGTLIIKVSFLKIHRLAFFLKNHTQCQFKILSDITATHHLNNISSLVIIYSLLSVTYNTRLLLYLSLEKEPFNLISLSPIYAVAN
jgi:NADH:ubiquinone oxidoreductase subunit C